MNEQRNPSDHNDPFGAIKTAEQLVAGLWQAERDEEKTKDAPPGSEAVEDEIKTLEAAVNQELQRRLDADPEARGFKAVFRIIELYRLKGADVPLWQVGGCDEGPCRDPECKASHHNPGLYLVTKRGDGSYAILEMEESKDERDKNLACFGREGTPTVIQINLGEMFGQAVEEKAKQLAETRTGPDDDDLPPAASIEVVEDEEVLGKIKEVVLGMETMPRTRVGPGDDTETRLPVMDIDEYRLVRLDEDKPSWLRRAWHWFWDWLRR